ncbi:MAG: BF3164 family lipoprotein [Rikenellaceae bacterium]
MKNKVLIILSITLLCSVSCVSNKNTTGEYPTIDIKGREFPNEVLSNTPMLCSVGDMLLTISSRAKPMMNLYSIGNELELVASYGTIGRSSDEFISLRIGAVIGDTIEVSDINKRRVTTLLYDREHERIVKLKHKDYNKIKLGKTDITMTDGLFQKLKNQNYVSLSRNGAESMFSLYDNELNFIKHFGYFEFIDGADPLEIINFMPGSIKSRGNNMVFATSRLPYIVMYTIDGDVIHKNWDDEILPVEVSVVNKGIRFNKEKSIGRCQHIDISDKYIYVLFSDAPLVDDERGGDIIYVYDYSGNKVARFNLEHLVGYMCVNKDDSKLYLSKVEDSKILECDISKYLK